MYRSFLSFRYLRTRFVNLISVAGVMVGVAVLIVVTSVMDGFQGKVREVLRGTLSHLILRLDARQQPPYESLDAQIRSQHPQVQATAPQITWWVVHPLKPGGGARSVQTFMDFLPMQAVGIDWNREIRVSQLGRYLVVAEDPKDPFANAAAADRGSKTCMVSRAFLGAVRGGMEPASAIGTIVEVLVPHEQIDPVNGDFTVATNTYRLVVSGVYDTENESADVNRIYLDIASLRDMAKLQADYTEVRASLFDYGDAPAVRNALNGRFFGMVARTWEDEQSQFLKAINNEKVILLVVLSFIVLLGGFTILATLTLTVVEKTRDIGLVKAIGGTTGGILSIFLRNGLLIGLLGGTLGLGLGLLFTRNVNAIKDWLRDAAGVNVFPSDIYLFREIPTQVDPTTVAGIVVGSVILAFLSGLPPALRGARLDPIKALRYE